MEGQRGSIESELMNDGEREPSSGAASTAASLDPVPDQAATPRHPEVRVSARPQEMPALEQQDLVEEEKETPA